MVGPYRPTVSQISRKRKASQISWSLIMGECEGAESIQDVANNHPELTYKQIYNKYKKYKTDGNNFIADSRGAHRRIFYDEEEILLAAAHIRATRDAQKVLITREFVQSEARKFFSTLHKYSSLRIHRCSFSDGWVQGFKSRHDFTTKQTARGPSTKSLPEDEQSDLAANYILDVNNAMEKYGSSMVLNMDETQLNF